MNEDDEKYLPVTYRLRRELVELIGKPAADKIQELIKAIIEEDRYDRSPDREYD
jgi:hypothetical protein